MVNMTPELRRKLSDEARTFVRENYTSPTAMDFALAENAMLRAANIVVHELIEKVK